MSAGFSNKQIYNRIYQRLKNIQRKAHKQNINLIYRNQALYDDDGIAVIWYRIYRASNDEMAGILENQSIFKF